MPVNLFILGVLLRVLGALKGGNPENIQAVATVCHRDVQGKIQELKRLQG